MIAALKLEKQLIEAVNQANLNNLNDIQVKLILENYQDISGDTIMEAKFDAFPLDLKTTEVKDKSKITEAVVTFVIRDSADIYKSFIPNASNATEAKNGDLKVFMIRSNGKWLWNPFGW